MKTESQSRLWLAVQWVSLATLFGFALARVIRWDVTVVYFVNVVNGPPWLAKTIGLIYTASFLVAPIGFVVKGIRQITLVYAGLLLLSATIFHAVRAATGDPLPCDTFGAAIPHLSQWLYCFGVLAAAVTLIAPTLRRRGTDAAKDSSDAERKTDQLLVMLYGSSVLACLGALGLIFKPGPAVATWIRPTLLPGFSKAQADELALMREPARPRSVVYLCLDFECEDCYPIEQYLLIHPELLARTNILSNPLPGIHPAAFSLAIVANLLDEKGELAANFGKLVEVGRSLSRVPMPRSTKFQFAEFLAPALRAFGLKPTDRELARASDLAKAQKSFLMSYRVVSTPTVILLQRGHAEAYANQQAVLMALATHYR